MARHVGDAGLRPVPVGHVGEGREPGSVVPSAAARPRRCGHWALGFERRRAIGLDVSSISGARSGISSRNDSREDAEWRVELGREQLLELAIADGRTQSVVEHAEALRHVVERRIEKDILRLKRILLFGQPPVLKPKLGIGGFDGAVGGGKVGGGAATGPRS